MPIPQNILDNFPKSSGSNPKKFVLPKDSSEYRTYIWDHKVSISEVNVNKEVHPEVILNRFLEAVFSASENAGWPLERRIEIGFITFQTRHDTDLIKYPQFGDNIQIGLDLAFTRLWVVY